MTRPLRKYSGKTSKLTLRPCFLEITRDINCIPAGVYRLRAKDEEGFQFSVGSKIKFYVLNTDEAGFREVPREEARKKAIRRDDFLDRYYKLREEGKRKPWKDMFKLIQSKTMCYVHHSVARDVH